MIRNHTTIVVAAGASNDLGLPLGPALQERVAKLLNDKGRLYNYFLNSARNLFEELEKRDAFEVAERARRFARQLLSAASIDNFLDQHNDDPYMLRFMKMIIAYALVEAEQCSKLSARQSGNEIIASTPDYFMAHLMNIVVRGHQKDNLSDSLRNLTFIIFNYDRCVERYLDLWLKFRFELGLKRLSEQPKFIHVYGSLDNYFEPESAGGFEYQGDFAFLNTHLELPRFADRLKIFTEQEESRVKKGY